MTYAPEGKRSERVEMMRQAKCEGWRGRGLKRFAVLFILPAVAGGCQSPAEPADSQDAVPASTPTPPSRPTGAIQIRAVTIGGSLDASFNRYTVKIGRDRVAAVGPNSSVLISGLGEGTYSVELVDLMTCQVLGSNPRNMTVAPLKVTGEIFRVHC